MIPGNLSSTLQSAETTVVTSNFDAIHLRYLDPIVGEANDRPPLPIIFLQMSASDSLVPLFDSDLDSFKHLLAEYVHGPWS